LAGVTPEKAIKLAANDLLREALELPDGTLPLHREMMAGAGMCVCVCVYVLFCVCTRVILFIFVLNICN
jgi:hypothetical protein